jgi:protein tyrosine phosphatase (PTP) superfamily phosphohydrolase (DUF442 family)
MQPTHLSEAVNFREVDTRLCTAGQPTEQQLASAAAYGVQVVINLALHDDPRYSLRDERASVEALGLTYVHIPVQFATPKETDLLAFFDAMDAHKERSVFVHCAANYRVTAFLGLYRIIRKGWSSEEAFELMRTVWEPNECWRLFIAAMLQKYCGS